MRRKIFYMAILIISLLAVRLIDFAIFSNLGNTEHNLFNKIEDCQEKQDETYYEFLGFSFYENAKKELLKLVEREKEKIIVLAFFDLVCPTRYLIYNKEKRSFISTPWIGIEVEKGFTEFNLFKFDFAEEKHDGRNKSYFLPVVGSVLTPYSFSYKNEALGNLEDSKREKSSEFNIVHVEYHFDSSYFLRNIYIFYFYMPLISMLLLRTKYSINLAFLYFAFMTVVFHPAHFWGYAPLWGLFNQFETIPLVRLIPIVTAIGYCFLFIKNIKTGIKSIREKKLELEEKYIISFFLLLPLFLRI